MLPASEHVSFVARTQICLRKLEAVRRTHEGIEACTHVDIILAGVCHEKDRPRMLATPHTSTQLM